MNQENKLLFAGLLIAVLHLCTPSISQAYAGQSKAKLTQAQPGNNDIEFIFAGRCMNGEPYRIFSYEKNIDGYTKSFYDFEGPVGKGTVMTSASPKTVAERICRQTAEMADGS